MLERYLWNGWMNGPGTAASLEHIRELSKVMVVTGLFVGRWAPVPWATPESGGHMADTRPGLTCLPGEEGGRTVKKQRHGGLWESILLGAREPLCSSPARHQAPQGQVDPRGTGAWPCHRTGLPHRAFVFLPGQACRSITGAKSASSNKHVI